MTERANAATELAREHAELDRLTARIAGLGPGSERVALVRDVSRLFLAHADAEQRHLYPALRNHLPNGWASVADLARRQRAVERTIRAIERLPEPVGDAYDILVSHLVVGIEDHVERQDAVLLGKLVDACTIDEINRLGERLSQAVEASLAHERAKAVEPPPVRQPESLPRGFRALLRLLSGRG
ncbi:MAG TPA: hemerythrin domain-containing protein [Actinospica sp.]|jgi:hypothetical protein|nr:hemerythrin domain-containing protein [Actinospica sp.]